MLSTGPSVLAGCGAAGPKRMASRTPAQPAGRSGDLKRKGPTGGRANGMPRNTVTSRSSVPRSLP